MLFNSDVSNKFFFFSDQMENCTVVKLAGNFVAFCCNSFTYVARNGTVVSAVEGSGEMCPQPTVPPLVIASGCNCDCGPWEILFWVSCALWLVALLAFAVGYKVVRCMRRGH